MKKLSAIIIAFTVFVVACSFNIFAIGETSGTVDCVFVVDASRSMGKSDPDFLRLEALTKFASLAPIESTRIGIVLFGDEIIRVQPMTEINSASDREEFDKVVATYTDLKGTTDIGLAMKYAVKMLADSGEGSAGKFIVFLSDGKTVISSTRTDRTLEDSEKDLDEAINTAAEKGFPIYPIGLNVSGDVDKDALDKISETTQLGEKYYGTKIIEDAFQLSDIFNDILNKNTGGYSKLIDGMDYIANGDYQKTPFDIEFNSVDMANVLINHTGAISDIKLYDNKDNEIPIGSDRAEIETHESFSTVHIKNPEKGTWALSIKADEGVRIAGILYIQLKDYRIKQEITTSDIVKSGSTVNISGSLLDENKEPCSDKDFLNMLSAYAVVTNIDTDASENISLQKKDNVFSGSYKLPDDGSYNVQIVVSSEKSDIYSEIITLEQNSKLYVPPFPLWIIIVGGIVAAILVIIIVIAKMRSMPPPMLSGKIRLSCRGTDITPRNGMICSLRDCSGGKRGCTLYTVMAKSFGTSDAEKAIPSSVSRKVKLFLDNTGRLCVKKPSVITASSSGNKIVLGNSNSCTLNYKVPKTNNQHSVTVTYMR